MDTNCDVATLLRECQRAWGQENCKRSGMSPVVQIGNPTTPGEESVDIANIGKAFSLAPRPRLSVPQILSVTVQIWTF